MSLLSAAFMYRTGLFILLVASLVTINAVEAWKTPQRALDGDASELILTKHTQVLDEIRIPTPCSISKLTIAEEVITSDHSNLLRMVISSCPLEEVRISSNLEASIMSLLAMQRSIRRVEISPMVSFNPGLFNHVEEFRVLGSGVMEKDEDSSSKLLRATAATNVVVSVNKTITNATFASLLCSQIGPDTTLITVAAVDDFFELPSCLAIDMPLLTYLSLQGVIINSWNQLPMASSSSLSMIIQNCRFPTFAGLNHWDALFTRIPSPYTLHIGSSALFSPLMDVIPSSVNMLTLRNCHLIGAIPSTLLSNARSTLIIDISFNQLSGAIPASLLSNHPGGSVLSLQLLSNGLTGPLPETLFSAYNGSNPMYVTFNAMENALSGTISPNLCTAPSLSRLTLRLANNRITGSLPMGIFSSGSVLNQLDLSFNDLLGSIPSSIGSFDLLTFLNLANNRLEGSLPSAFCSSFAVKDYQLQNNRISGSVPSTLFGDCTGMVLNLANNSLSGYLPAPLFKGDGSRLDLSFNSIEGLLPGTFKDTIRCSLDLSGTDSITSFPAGVFDNSSMASLTMVNSSLTGPLPASMFFNSVRAKAILTNNAITSLPSGLFSGSRSAQLNLDGNSLSGSLPGSLFDNSTNPLLSVRNNRLNGVLPSDLFAGVKLESTSSEGILLYADNNQFSGDLPQNGWESVNTFSMPGNAITKFSLTSSHLTSTASSLPRLLSVLDLSNNQLTDLPDDAVFGLLTANITEFNVGRNPSLGAGRSLPFASLTSHMMLTRRYDVSLCRFTGSLIDLQNPSDQRPARHVNLSRNALSGTLPKSWSSIVFSVIDISGNVNISGPMGLRPFGNYPSDFVTAIDLSETSLTGPMFDINHFSFVAHSTLRLERTQSLNFCARFVNGTARSPWKYSGPTIDCSFDGTSACECPDLYPTCISYECPPATCSGVKPSLEFICINGSWTSASNYLDSYLIINGPGTVVVAGNLTSSELILSSIDSQVVVQGCADQLKNVTIVLTPEQLEQGFGKSKTKMRSLLQLQNTSACNSVDLNTFEISVSGSTCKKVKVQQTSSTTTLGALFTLDNRKCQLWWIILVAVVCGVIVLGVAVFVALVLFVPSIRVKVRPYTQALDSRRTHAKRETMAHSEAHKNDSEDSL